MKTFKMTCVKQNCETTQKENYSLLENIIEEETAEEAIANYAQQYYEECIDNANLFKMGKPIINNQTNEVIFNGYSYHFFAEDITEIITSLKFKITNKEKFFEWVKANSKSVYNNYEEWLNELIQRAEETGLERYEMSPVETKSGRPEIYDFRHQIEYNDEGEVIREEYIL